MRIGFDAKRAFFNTSGLGNYSRNLIRALKRFFPENKYYLYTPGITNHLFNEAPLDYTIRTPNNIFYKTFSSYWRTYPILKSVKKDKLDVYHGLSHELPVDIENYGIKTVVTIHDLIFLRYPQLYSKIDRTIYNKKFYSACKRADTIIAVSKQTANDVQEMYDISAKKINVIYQGVNQQFHYNLSEEEKVKLIQKYNLPTEFILYVGVIEERKNLLTIIKAMHEGNIKIPLVVIGKRTHYFKQVNDYIIRNKINNCIFIDTVQNAELPGFYQCASLFVYPSIYEGFGIPILEALFSKTPVITSKGGVFSEAGGPASMYIDPANADELAAGITKIVNDSDLQIKMIEEGYRHALHFSDDVISVKMMNLYESLLTE